jgi:hypothetical protein
MLTGVWGAFVFGAVVAVSPSRWNMFSLRGMFLHCPSNAHYLYASPNESLAENAASPLAVGEVPLVSGNSGDRLAQGNGRGSRTATQFWFGIAGCSPSNRWPVWDHARVLPADSRFPQSRQRALSRY